MTPTEATELEARLNRSRIVLQRCNQLKDALVKLESKDTPNVLFRFDKDEVYYQSLENNDVRDLETPQKSMRRVCWADQFPGIGTEIRESIIRILEEKISQAETEYSEI